MKRHQPPRFARQILQWFCHAEFIEEVEGDLFQLFQYRVEHQGLLKARLGYLKDVFHSINPYRAQPRKTTRTPSLNIGDRLNHFFKFAFRNLVRSRTSSIINLTGLAVSLASFFLIAVYLIDESTYEDVHPGASDVYRISYSFKGFDGKEHKDSRAAGLWSVKLKELMPEVEQFTRYSRFGYPGKVWSDNPDHVFVETLFLWVDSTLTDIFSIPLVNGGDAKSILRNPQYVIINENIAIKYFGTTDPIGKSMTYVRDGMSFSFTVGAVMKNAASNTHFKPDFIANCIALDPLWKRNNEDRINSWMDSFSFSFIRLQPGTDLDKVRTTLQQIFNNNLGERAATTHPILTPLRDIHFTSGQLFELEAPGDKTHLYIIGSIGLLILGMACMNYMNLATARSMRRTKEVGVRKTLGVSKISLVGQFLGESFLMTTMAMSIAIVLFVLFLPAFNALTLKSFTLLSLLQYKALFIVVGGIISVAVLAGLYPAFYLSGFKPVQVIKGAVVAGRGPENFRKTLVVVQICITLLLLSGTYVINRQLNFIDHTKLSEFKDQIVTLRLGDQKKDVSVFTQRAKQDPRVKEISLGPHLPRRENFGNMSRAFQFKELGESKFAFEQMDVDFEFPSMFALEFIAGRDFSKSNAADTTAIILNEGAVKELGISPEKAIGLQAENTTFYERQGQMVAVTALHKVIGVVKDFSYTSMHQTIGPIAISGESKAAEMMYIRLQGDGKQFHETIDYLLKTWRQIYPATPFQYWFMDEEFDRLYQTERQMGELFIYLAGMAILIACLGLFGLASFTAEQKTKEIGIRKVLGASSIQVLMLLTSRYVKLALIAFLIGIPLAFLAVNSWMKTFVYKAEVGLSFYAWSCLIIISIILFTVGIESLKAARANPSDSIRHE